jgi:hypothetical protein
MVGSFPPCSEVPPGASVMGEAWSDVAQTLRIMSVDCSHTRSGYPIRCFRIESLPVELEVTACAADNAPTHTAVL